LTAALDIAEAGYPVVLVEREGRLGGRMAELAPLYLNFDDSQDLLGSRITAVTQHPLIEVFTSAQVAAFEGYLGNFSATIETRSRPTPGVLEVPARPGQPEGEGTARPIRVDVGAVVLATGLQLYPPEKLPEYGGGHYPDVVDTLQFEAMLLSGEIRRPSDGHVPREIVWIQCAGSRDPQHHRSYCSKICCMAVAKQATAYRRALPDTQAYVFYIDIRSQGRGYDEFVQRAMEEFGVVYLRGKVSRVVEAGRRLEVWGADTLSGRALRVQADLVVLAMASVPSEGSERLARLMRVSIDESGFFAEAHPKLRPVESLTAGIFLAGAAQFPKDIPESVAQGSGAAAKVLQIFVRQQLTAEPTVAVVDEELCVGCARCVPACPYDARALHPWRKLATVTAALCQRCGACTVACPNKATTVRNATPRQLMAMVDAILAPPGPP
jgi:heterodisulfide reductase subunit A